MDAVALCQWMPSTSPLGGPKTMSVKIRKGASAALWGEPARGCTHHWVLDPADTLTHPCFFLSLFSRSWLPGSLRAPEGVCTLPILAHLPIPWQNSGKKRWCGWKVGWPNGYGETTGHEVPEGNRWMISASLRKERKKPPCCCPGFS